LQIAVKPVFFKFQISDLKNCQIFKISNVKKF
jgi:hypothetical protein